MCYVAIANGVKSTTSVSFILILHIQYTVVMFLFPGIMLETYLYRKICFRKTLPTWDILNQLHFRMISNKDTTK